MIFGAVSGRIAENGCGLLTFLLDGGTAHLGKNVALLFQQISPDVLERALHNENKNYCQRIIERFLAAYKFSGS